MPVCVKGDQCLNIAMGRAAWRDSVARLCFTRVFLPQNYACILTSPLCIATGAVRGRAKELLGTGGKTEAIEGEEVEWLVQTALRCNALDVICSSALTRSAFVALMRGSSFPHASTPTANGGEDGGGGGDTGGSASVVVAGYAVMSSGAEMAVHIVPRRESELLALAVVQMVEAGDVVGAGILVLRATQTHPTLASSPSSSIAALQAFLLRIQSVSADFASRGDCGISAEVRCRCQAAMAAFQKMLASASAR